MLRLSEKNSTGSSATRDIRDFSTVSVKSGGQERVVVYGDSCCWYHKWSPSVCSPCLLQQYFSQKRITAVYSTGTSCSDYTELYKSLITRAKLASLSLSFSDKPTEFDAECPLTHGQQTWSTRVSPSSGVSLQFSSNRLHELPGFP